MDFEETFGEMEDFKSVVNFQRNVSRRFREDFYSLISLYESLSDIYLNTVKKLKVRVEAGEKDLRHEVTFLLMARIFNHSLSAFTLLERGMLIDGAAVIRHVLETQWLLEYFYENPHKIESWMEGKRIKPSEVRRNLKLDEERSFLYGEYCKMTHNNIEAARYYSGSQGESDCIIFGGYYNPLYIEQLLSELIIYITTTLFIVNYAYKQELHDLTAVNRKLNSMLKVIIRRLADISHMEEA